MSAGKVLDAILARMDYRAPLVGPRAVQPFEEVTPREY